MASSMLTADKRWAASTRKSGMTVLGKIPKPINLPSQRLENHGLDPNVEIVPKGTLTWGSKPAATTPNAWISSSLLSPKNDGGSGSPSHINDRPSSGGGSRPSTAGSESLDSPNAWGPNSRPSTASSTLPSHHLQMATTRPRSAETRPGSSQLSRFADNPSENIKVSIRTIEKSGSSSHGHGFTLSTGDFPSLGSEKISESSSQRGHSSKGRPTSSSGKEAAENEQGKSRTAGSGEEILSANNQPADVMKTEQHAYDRGAPFPTTIQPNEAQQPHPYPPNFCMPHPQFDSWHAPPGHPPEGMWHRGPAPGGPYRPVALPGSFPVEPFPYYGQFPHNSEAAARQGSAQGGYHPKNGDAYQSMPPNSYIMNQPVIPVRPVYQGPMPYDGYYGPPRPNLNNSNARDSPLVGGPHQPGILNQVPNQNDMFQPGYSQNRPKEQLESDRVHVVRRGQPRILHDNPDRLGGPCEVERKAQPAPPLLPNPDVNWADVNMRADMKDTFSEKNMMMLVKSVPDHRGPTRISHSSFSENAHSYPMDADDGTLRKKFKEDNSVTPGLQPVIKKNVSLIEKIEGLNNKARNVDARNIAEPFSSKEHKEKQLKGANVKTDQRLPNSPIDGVIVGPLHKHLTEASKTGHLGESTHDIMHRRGDSSRNSHHGSVKDKSANDFARNGRGESSTTECSPVVDLSNSQHDQPLENASQLPPVAVTDDMQASLDYESQRVKMRELAAQRAKQLQFEEEERTKQQKAKALAKLEELNRRSSVHQKNSIDASPEINSVCNKQKAGHDVSTKLAASIAESSEPPTGPKHRVLSVQSKSAKLSDAAGAGKVPADNNISSASNTESNTTGHDVQKKISQLHDNIVSKPKQGYRKRLVVSEEKIPGEKSSFALSTENARKLVEPSLDAPTSIISLHDEPSAHNKKSARHPRNKKKVDDAPVTSEHSPIFLNEQNTVKVSNEPKNQTAGVIINSSIVPTEGTIVTVGSITVGGISFGSLNQECPKPPEEAHNTSNSHPRPQHAKRSGKNQHAVRPVEKPHGNEGVVWTPVKPSGQNDQSDKAMLNAAVTAPAQSAGKNTNDGENVIRTKRAEMERYVPKPMSKELQQQNLGQNLPSEKSYVDNSSHDKEAVEKSTATKSEATANLKKSEDKKSSRGHGKSHSSWRRRNTNESALLVPNPADRVDYSQESDEVKKPSDQHKALEPDKQADATAENNLAPTAAIPVGPAKECAGNRQRRQHVRAQRNEGSNYSTESKDREGRKNEHQMPTLVMDSNSSEYRNISKSDVKNSGTATHSRTHWKPKSNPLSQSNLQGNNAMGGQVDNSTLQDGNHNLPRSIDGIGEKNLNSEECKGEMSSVDDNQKAQNHEFEEQQHLNPVPRRQGHHNGRYHRGGGAHRGRGYDAGKQSHGTNAERRRGGTHLEYQPVGTYFQQNPSSDEHTEGPSAPGPVYRERSLNKGPHPSGHFVKRNPVSAPVANPCQDE